jgi:hypothetical protein
MMLDRHVPGGYYSNSCSAAQVRVRVSPPDGPHSARALRAAVPKNPLHIPPTAAIPKHQSTVGQTGKRGAR